MLIIEGADHLGKTTAAKRLVALAAQHRHYPIRYAHMSRPNEAFDFLHDYQDLSSKFAVQDRFHIGGLVWHENKISLDGLKLIEGRLQSMGSVCVVMYSSDEEWYHAELTTNRKKEMFDVDTIMKANRAFRDLANEVCWCDILFDVADGGYPTDQDMEGWLAKWYTRLGMLEPKRS